VLLGLGVASAPVRAEDSIVLIANAELAEPLELSLPVLRQLFLGRRSSLEGMRIHCFEPPPGTTLRRAFARLVLEQTERGLERYWLEQALTGGPLPPRELPSEAELVRRVAARRGALAYLGWEKLKQLPRDGVRVVPLRHEGRLLGPDDPAYPLRTRGAQERDPAGRNDPG
jgi:hypothetical protein